MEELKLLIKSLAKNPIISLITLIILVQSYIMVEKLDKINETLVAIHKDNTVVSIAMSDDKSLQQTILEKINYLIGVIK